MEGKFYWNIEVTVSGRCVAYCPATGEKRVCEKKTIEASLRSLGRTIDNDRKKA